MADVRPFRGLRYDPAVSGEWGGLLGPPYDVISPGQQEALLASSPYQITHVESPGDGGARAAAELLRGWREGGALKRDPEPSFYLARHRFQDPEGRDGGVSRERTTLFAAVRLTPWGEAHPSGGSTKPHEWTMPGPKQQRTALRATARSDISPLMVLAPDERGALGAALARLNDAEPVVAGTDAAGDEHSLVVVEDETDVGVIREALARETLYMADGHHRYESALSYRDDRARKAGITWQGDEPENFVLMGIVRAQDPGLIVGATHRLLHVAPPADALARLRELFSVEVVTPAGDALSLAARVEEAGEGRVVIGVHGLDPAADLLLIANDHTRASLPAELPASWAGLGAAVLQFGALAPVFGVDEERLRQGQAVTYEHDAAAALAAVDAGEARLAFLLQAPTLGQIFRAADAGDRMPQKSTYFVPKLPTGIVVYAFDAGDDQLF